MTLGQGRRADAEGIAATRTGMTRPGRSRGDQMCDAVCDRMSGLGVSGLTGLIVERPKMLPSSHRLRKRVATNSQHKDGAASAGHAPSSRPRGSRLFDN